MQCLVRHMYIIYATRYTYHKQYKPNLKVIDEHVCSCILCMP